MPRFIVSRWQKRLILLSALGLGLTGLGQMPIFSRYYIADVPGLGWLGNFRITAALHLALACALLFALASVAVAWLGAGRERPSLSGAGRMKVALFAAVALTGLLRVLQNGAFPLFSPMTVRYLDWSHLGFAAALGIAALAIRPKKRSGSPQPVESAVFNKA